KYHKRRSDPPGRNADNGIDAGVVGGVAAEYFHADHRLLQVFRAPVERSLHDEAQELPQPQRCCETGAGGDPVKGVASCIRRQEHPSLLDCERWAGSVSSAKVTVT